MSVIFQVYFSIDFDNKYLDPTTNPKFQNDEFMELGIKLPRKLHFCP